MRCAVCVAYDSAHSFSFSLHKFSRLLLASIVKKQIVNINSKLLNMHQFVLFALSFSLLLPSCIENIFLSRVCLPPIPINKFEKHFYQQRMSTQMESKSDTSQIILFCPLCCAHDWAAASIERRRMQRDINKFHSDEIHFYASVPDQCERNRIIMESTAIKFPFFIMERCFSRS